MADALLGSTVSGVHFRCRRTVDQIRVLEFTSIHAGLRQLHDILTQAKANSTYPIPDKDNLNRLAEVLQWPEIDKESFSEFMRRTDSTAITLLMKFVAEHIYCIFYPGYVTHQTFGKTATEGRYALGEELMNCLLQAGKGTLSIQRKRRAVIEQNCGSASPPSFDVRLVALEFNIHDVPEDLTASELCDLLRKLNYTPEIVEDAQPELAAGSVEIQQTPAHAMTREQATAAVQAQESRGLGPALRLAREDVEEMKRPQLEPAQRLPLPAQRLPATPPAPALPATPPAPAPAPLLPQPIRASDEQLRETRDALEQALAKLREA
jgi:hypothetical protein